MPHIYSISGFHDVSIVASLCICVNQRFALLGFTQSALVVTYRRFGTIYRSQLQGSSSSKRISKHFGTQLLPPSTLFPT